MKQNRQELNVDKCVVMIIGNKKYKRILADTSISINNVPLNRVKSIKILGVTIDEDLNFNDHCKNVARKCHGALWPLRPLKYVLSHPHKLIVVQALVNSIYTYACPVWLIGKKNITGIDKIIRACARFISGKSKYDSIIDDINNYGWLLAQNVVNFELMKISYKILNECGPTYFKNYLTLANDTKCTRNKTYSEPLLNIKNNIAKKSFRYRALKKKILNVPELSLEYIRHVNFTVFKNFVKTFLIDKQRAERMSEIFELIDNYEFENCIN